MRQHIRYVHEDACSDVLILSGDQLYRMDFRQLLADAPRQPRPTSPSPSCRCRASRRAGFGIVRLDDAGRVIGFVEKPQDRRAAGAVCTPRRVDASSAASPATGRHYLASMGIYLFKRDVLLDLLNAQPLATDFGKEIFPRSIKTHHVQAHLFDGYWEDLGTIKAYHEANLALAGDNPPFDFHSPEGVIYTRMRFLPASRISGADAGAVPDQRRLRHRAGAQHRALRRRRPQPDRPQRRRARHGDHRRRPLRDRRRAGRQPRPRRARPEHRRRRRHRAGHPRQGLPHRPQRADRQPAQACEDDEGDNYVIRDGIVVIPKGDSGAWTGR